MTKARPNRLSYLLLTLLGAVLVIFGPVQALEASYRGFATSYAFCLCSLIAGWCLWWGLVGLGFGSPRLRSFPLLFVLALPLGAVMPGVSRSYHERDERAAWQRVIDSQNAELWQNRYVSRVPETFRRTGWRSEYALAVCRYSLDKDNTQTLPWYAEQAFQAHPEWYDERVRQALRQTYRTFLAAIIKRDQPPEGWRQALLYLSEKPSRAIAWGMGRVPRLERQVREHYRGLVVFREPGEKRSDDVVWDLDASRCLLRAGNKRLPVFLTDQLVLD